MKRKQNEENKLKAVIFDWAGTIVDFGCQAPIKAFWAIFDKRGIKIEEEIIRKYMGLSKKEHILSISLEKEVMEQWKKLNNRDINDQDIERMYQEIIPTFNQSVLEYSQIIPGLHEVMEVLRDKYLLKMGSTTGYTTEIIKTLNAEVENQGVHLDSIVCSDQVSRGRPAPWMCYKSLNELDVYPINCVVKVGDTVSDIQEGLNAGAWTVGVAQTGNKMGLTNSDLNALSKKELERRTNQIYQELYDEGAHYVIDSVVDLPQIIEKINNKLKHEE